MKALSVHQPWAWMIAEGHKTIELRKRPTYYRGPSSALGSAGPSAQQRRSWGHLGLLTMLGRELKRKVRIYGTTEPVR